MAEMSEGRRSPSRGRPHLRLDASFARSTGWPQRHRRRRPPAPHAASIRISTMSARPDPIGRGVRGARRGRSWCARRWPRTVPARTPRRSASSAAREVVAEAHFTAAEAPRPGTRRARRPGARLRRWPPRSRASTAGRATQEVIPCGTPSMPPSVWPMAWPGPHPRPAAAPRTDRQRHMPSWRSSLASMSSGAALLARSPPAGRFSPSPASASANGEQ